MWIKQVGLRESIEGKKGTIWHFRYWSDLTGKAYKQRIFFWDDNYTNTGMMEFMGDQTIHWSRIKDRVIKLANEKEYREKFICELKFPVEKNY
jgi:hypothetical protein